MFCHPKTMKAQKLGTTVIWGDIGNVEKSKDAKSSLTMAFYRMGPWELTEDKNNHLVSQKHWECGMNVIVKGYYNALLWSTLGTFENNIKCLVNVGNDWKIIIKMLGQRWELFYFNNSQRWPANKIASHHSQLGQRWELTRFLGSLK